MKPSHRSTLCSLAISLLLLLAQPIFAATQATFYVSPSGNDSGSGTISSPFLTIGRAQTAVRGQSGSMNGDIIVYLRAGVYPLSAPLTFGTQDSGTNGYHVIYEAYGNEVPVISGGVPVTGWTQVSGNIYSAPLSRSTKLRSLFVNGVRASMTKSGPVQGYGNESVFTIPSSASYSIGGASGSLPDDVQFSEPAVGFYANPSDIELLQNYTFNSSIVTVRNIANYGGNPDFQLQEPYGALAGSMLYGTGLNPGGAFYIMNAYELLNSPGQFYFNRTTQTLYYYSRGENMATAQVIVPTTEGLIQIHGSSNTSRVTNIEFQGITFAYDHWQMYNVAGSYGMAATQSVAGQVAYAGGNNWHGVTYNDTENPQASIDVQNASGIVFQGNSFEHLSSGSALGLTDDVINSTVLGNDFVDLAGNAITVGNAQNAYPNTSRLYPPSLWGVCTNNILQDNLIRYPNQLYYQFEGIAAAYDNGLQILHNDIGATGYDAITLGWGWQVTTSSTSSGNNNVSYNRVTQSNQIINADGGSLYFLGQQPNTTISNNYISNGLTGLYEDAGSAYLTLSNNVIANEGWLYVSDPSDNNLTIENNYYNTNIDIISSNQNIVVTNNHYETTFDSTAQGIINASGLEPAYQYLLSAPIVSSLTAANGANGVSLSWQNTGVATSFNIYRSTTPGGEGAIPYQAGISGSTFTDTSASSGSTYYYKVTAMGLGGESPASNEATSSGLSSQTIVFNAIPPQAVGGTLTPTATASSGLPVTFTVVPNGNCSISGNVVTFLNSGACGIVANQAGNATYAPAPTVGQVVQVSLTAQSQTITFGPIPAQALGNSLTVSATASSGLPVTFSVVPNGNCSVSGNVVTFLNVGNCGVLANQAGNASYTAAAQVGQIVVVNNPTPQTITFSSIAVQKVGAPLTLSATASSGLAVTFASSTASVCTVSGTTANFANAGTCTITASQAGGGAYSAATPVSRSFTVTASQQSQTITFNAIPAQTLGTTLTVSATASSGLPVTFSVVPNGNCSVSGNVVTFLGTGNCGVLANQAGNSSYTAAAQVGQIIVVNNPTPQTITFGAISAQKVGTPLTLSATASSGLAVTFASSTTGVCTVSGSTASFANAGTCTITASQAGNGTYSAATPVSQSFTVTASQQSQTITFGAIPSQTIGSKIGVNATASSGLPVTYSVVQNGNCSVSGNVVTMLAAGNCGVLANQAGNASYTAAAQVGQIVVVGNAAFKLTPASPTLALAPSNGTAMAITVTPVGNFNGTLNYSVSGGPTGASYAFVQTSTSGTTFVIYLQSSTAPGTYNLTITGTSGSTNASTTIALTVS